LIGDDVVVDNAVVDDDEAVAADVAIDVVAVVVFEPFAAEQPKQPRQKLT
jgi:hypothetical protein